MNIPFNDACDGSGDRLSSFVSDFVCMFSISPFVFSCEEVDVDVDAPSWFMSSLSLFRFFFLRFFFFPVDVVSGGLTTCGFGVGERRNERIMFSRYSSVILLKSRSHSLSSPEMI